jgi:hypothetical protein
MVVLWEVGVGRSLAPIVWSSPELPEQRVIGLQPRLAPGLHPVLVCRRLDVLTSDEVPEGVRGGEEEEEERFYSPFGGNGAYWTREGRSMRGGEGRGGQRQSALNPIPQSLHPFHAPQGRMLTGSCLR